MYDDVGFVREHKITVAVIRVKKREDTELGPSSANTLSIISVILGVLYRMGTIHK